MNHGGFSVNEMHFWFSAQTKQILSKQESPFSGRFAGLGLLHGGGYL